MPIISYNDYVVSQAEKDFYAEMYEAREVLKAIKAGETLAERYQPNWSDQSIVTDCKRNSYSRYFADYYKQPAEPDYLCFTAGVDNCVIGWNLKNMDESKPTYAWFPDLWWSTDKSNWTQVTNAGQTKNGTITTLSNGEKIYLKGTNTAMANIETLDVFYFDLQQSVAASGDCTSILNSTGGLLDLTDHAGAFMFLFLFCTGLTSAPLLPSTTLSLCCYGGEAGMFYGCTSLTTAPALPATTLAEGCYSAMFAGCTSLTTAPALPATTLAKNCYDYMFNGCTSLTTAPALPATTLAKNCYKLMFRGCINLNSVSVSATSWNSDYTNSWLENVSATGTFTKPSATTIPSGVSGIPEGWTVVNV